MEFPPPKPPGTPIPPTPFLEGDDTPSPFFPPIDTRHLIPSDSRRGSLAQFVDPFQTPPASPLSRYFGPNGSGSEANGASPTSSAPPSAPASVRKPFNFQPMAAAKSPVIGKPAQRRGHRYKHSSVSHQIFLEPPPRAPLSLPASLPVPTLREALSSITAPQRTRALWCLTHILTSCYVLWSSGGSLALTALSHVLLFDAFGACVFVAVEVLSNFEVWRRSTIRHPFGLERVEVLAGFAMAVFIVFMGLDIISHTAEHFLEGMGETTSTTTTSGEGEHPPLPGSDARIQLGAIDVPALLAITSTLISALFLKNHTHITSPSSASTPTTPKTHEKPQNTNSSNNILPSASSTTSSTTLLAPSTLALISANPAHILTLAVASLLLILPLLRIPFPEPLDLILALAIASCMLIFGTRMLKSLGSMLLMSIHVPAGSIEGVVSEIESLGGGVKRVIEAKVWQVHYGLGMVGMKVLLDKGESEATVAGVVRERVERIVRERLGGGAVKWEVSVAVCVD
ncbi:cation efflux family protein family [Peziza echinospora]|nr:cation efflux family protein family [Peziza echinospora]